MTRDELGELKAGTKECGDHLWAVDPSAQVVLKLDPTSLIQLVMINRKGHIMYRGDFPRDSGDAFLPSYDGLKQMVDKALAQG